MARDRGARPMASITSRCCECPSQYNAWQGTCSSIWREGTCFLSFHTSDFRPWSKNCRMSWPPIQLVQTDTQTRKEWQPLRTAFTPSPRSWLDSWIALMAADCPSHPGVWNLSPLAPSYLLVSSGLRTMESHWPVLGNVSYIKGEHVVKYTQELV